MKASELEVGDGIKFDVPEGLYMGFRDIAEGGIFCVVRKGGTWVNVDNGNGEFPITEGGLLRWAVKVGEESDDVSEDSAQASYDIEEEMEEEQEVFVASSEGPAEEDGGQADADYFSAKADSGKPAARLIPLHALIDEADAGVRGLGWYIYRKAFFDALCELDSIISEGYPGEDVVSFGLAALDYGLGKYGKEGSWADVPDGERRYRDALARHFINHFWRGEDQDEESGLSHLCHMAANLMFLASGELKDE